MPRPRRPRTIGAEDQLAKRVRDEMTRHRWSYAQLAASMGGQGVSISASSLRESFSPSVRPEDRRPIRVDELVALAKVLRTPVENLLGPRQWVDQEQVDKAAMDMDRADRLLVEVVQTMLDAQVMLIRAAADAPPDTVNQVVGQNTTYWWATTDQMRLTPRGATAESAPISTQAVGQRIKALKEVIHAIAERWCIDEYFRTFRPAHAHTGPTLIGSEEWDRQRPNNAEVPLDVQSGEDILAAAERRLAERDAE